MYVVLYTNMKHKENKINDKNNDFKTKLKPV